GYATDEHTTGSSQPTGVDGEVYINSPAPVLNAEGHYGFVQKDGNGTLDRLFDYFADNPVYLKGNINNAYGLDVNNFTGTASSTYGVYTTSNAGANDYAVYTGGTAKSYFGGNVGVGTTSPGTALGVAGRLLVNGDVMVDNFGSGNLRTTGSVYTT